MKRNAAALVLAHSVRYVGQVSVLVVVALSGSARDVGLLSLSLATTAPIFVVFSLGMRTLILTHRSDYPLEAYLRVRAYTAVVAVALGALVGFVALGLDAAPFLVGAILMKLADYVVDFATAWLQLRQRFQLLVAISASSAAATALGAVTGILISPAMSPLFAGLGPIVLALVWVIPLLVSAIREEAGRGRSPAGASRDILRAGFPLGLSYGAVSLLVALPQIALAALSSVEDAGRFAILYYLIVGAELVTNPLSQSWIQNRRAALRTSRHPRGFVAREILRLSLGLAVVFAAGVVVGAFVLPVVFGTYYRIDTWEGLALFGCMLLIPAVYLGASALAVLNRYRASLIAVVPALAICGLACAALIPTYGTLGAILAYMLSLATRGAAPFFAIATRTEDHG
ncbi:lipopolysaccharide biosynthesis protein [Microbacterium sp. XT11]|uniref:lipopolysaccharide biosynthesis protein n=1 Tax=Microbacterium sp. XT11 TaxID=367477 RepID=UPI0008350EC9|nr:hypothetical protein [Microbacterium sp. XT11]